MAFRKKNNLLLNKLNARSSQAQIEIVLETFKVLFSPLNKKNEKVLLLSAIL